MIRTTFGVTDPETPIRAYLGGTGHDIPVIELGEQYCAEVSISVHPTLLTPHEQVAFLHRLSSEIGVLALALAQAHAKPVSGVAS